MFFIIPVGVDYRAQRWPVVTFTLIGINVVVYLLTLVITGNAETPEGQLSEFEKALWLVPVHSLWYTYFTALFVHAGFFHLLGNMIYLFLFGAPVEDAVGRWRFIIFYLLGGLSSDFAHIAFSPDHFSSEIALGGASGAVSACMGGFILLFAKTRVEFKYVLFLVFRFWSGEFFLPAWLVLSFWFLKDLASAVLSVMAEHTGGGVAFGAHVGGFAGGLVLMLLIKLMRKREAPEEAAWQPIVAAVTPPNSTPVYVYDAGNQLGPFTVSQVAQMLALGSISQEAVYWCDGMPEWRSVLEICP